MDSPGFAHGPAERGRLEKLKNRIGKRLPVIGRNQNAGYAILHRIGDPPDVMGNYWQAASARFQVDEAKSLHTEF